MMRLVTVGLNHKSAPTELRERFAGLEVEKVLDRLFALGWEETVVVSTCNRFEVYAAAKDHHSVTDLSVALESIADHSMGESGYCLEGPEAAAHFFRVSAGLDSLVVGESEIASQIKRAYELSLRREQTGTLLNVLFQRGLYLGKRIRTETGLSAGVTSVAGTAVQMAQAIFGDLSSSEALVLGAGETAEIAMKHLQAKEVKRLFVTNRTWERGVRLAERFGAAAVRWGDFHRYLETADVVLCSTGSPKPILTREAIARALPARKGRSLFLIDIAMPRDVEDTVTSFENVYLYTLEDLEGLVAKTLGTRQGEIAQARALVDAKAEEFARWLSARQSGQVASFKHSAR